jgi:hypothetical protein
MSLVSEIATDVYPLPQPAAGGGRLGEGVRIGVIAISLARLLHRPHKETAEKVGASELKSIFHVNNFDGG